MPDLFTSLVAIAPGVVKVGGRQAERAPGISPSMKDGIWGERAFAPAGAATYLTQAGLSAVVKGEVLLSAGMDTHVVKAGHALDANTLALWRFDEAAGNTCADEAGNYLLTGSNSPTIGTGTINRAREFNGTNQAFSGGVIPGGQVALWLGDFSMEAWIKLDAAFTATGNVVDAAGLGETLATNIPAMLQITSTRLIHGFWEYGAGVNVEGYSTNTIPLNTWTHVAWTRELVATTYTLRFYINGVLDNTVTSLTAPAGATSATITIGNSVSGAQFFKGAIDEIRLSFVKRSDAEILASYQLGL